MKIEYRTNTDGLEPSMLAGFFEGWPNQPSPETHRRILRTSSHVVLAFDEEASRVVGFINAVSDGFYSALIPLLEVLPEYRGRGIGAELVRRMTGQLREFYSIDLVCDPELQPFYEKCGYQRVCAMSIRNFDRQTGSLKVHELADRSLSNQVELFRRAMRINDLSTRFLHQLLLEFPDLADHVEPDRQPGTVLIEIPAPSGAGHLWISTLDDEITVGFDGWHCHYDCWDHAQRRLSFAEPIEVIGGLMSGRLRVAVREQDGQWKGGALLGPGEQPEPREHTTVRVVSFTT